MFIKTKVYIWTSGQWLRLHASTARVWVLFLVRGTKILCLVVHLLKEKKNLYIIGGIGMAGKRI